MSDEQLGDADRLAAAAEEVEAGRGPVAVARPGHQLVVLVSAEEWQRLEELESAESTAWWRRDAAERAAAGEEPGAGEDGPGLDEGAFRRRLVTCSLTPAPRDRPGRPVEARCASPGAAPAHPAA